jgi:hypothetical protein
MNEDHGLATGSYATTKTDLTIVPSGLVAVGRFALPTRISARYVFRITPGKGVKIFYGTVIPKYGLCGGGVEVFSPDGTKQTLSIFGGPFPQSKQLTALAQSCGLPRVTQRLRFCPRSITRGRHSSNGMA